MFLVSIYFILFMHVRAYKTRRCCDVEADVMKAVTLKKPLQPSHVRTP